MTEMTENQTKWHQDSILIKLGVITALILLLLIPSSWIESLITDREGYQQQMAATTSDKWSGSQLVQGPVLMLPYRRAVTEDNAQGKAVTHDVTKILYLLPQNLQIKANVKSRQYDRGVYDAIVYNSKINLKGDFKNPDLNAIGMDGATILYDKARLVFSISDLKGLTNNPVVNIQGQNYNAQPAESGHLPFDNGLQVSFLMQKDQGVAFNCELDVKGSNDLNFLDIGNMTDVEATSDWLTPQINGRYLPDTQINGNKSLGLKWHMLYHNQSFPRQWTDNDTILTSKKALTNAVFGIKLQLPVDQYRKIMRTTKYSTLIILLTFVSLFLTEMIKKQRIHLFNYTLIGAAMVVYYTLLLSFAEQIGFTWAYLLSSVSTITLISVFTASLLKNGKVALLFASILSIFYGFIFVIIQLEELSLLFGSIALFVIIAMLMYFSRKINWDKH